LLLGVPCNPLLGTDAELLNRSVLVCMKLLQRPRTRRSAMLARSSSRRSSPGRRCERDRMRGISLDHGRPLDLVSV
jgi:hypothetical protein